MIYAGIGSRETPDEILDVMQEIALDLGGRGFVLRSGHAPGADQAFEKGARGYDAQIFLPWMGFGRTVAIDAPHVQHLPTHNALNTVSKYHPNPKALSAGARLLHARNAQIVLGQSLDDPVDFIICWTKDAKGGGGTGQALRIARDKRIPWFDLADKSHLTALGNAISQSNLEELLSLRKLLDML